MKVDRYYVDAHPNIETNIVIRDRISPLSKLLYPTDIAVVVTARMFTDRNQMQEVAEKICELLNALE